MHKLQLTITHDSFRVTYRRSDHSRQLTLLQNPPGLRGIEEPHASTIQPAFGTLTTLSEAVKPKHQRAGESTKTVYYKATTEPAPEIARCV